MDTIFESDRDLAGIRDAFAVALLGITCAGLCDSEAGICVVRIPRPVEPVEPVEIQSSGTLLPNETDFVCVQSIAASGCRAWLLEMYQ